MICFINDNTNAWLVLISLYLWIYICSSEQWHLSPNLCQKIQINVRDGDLRLLIVIAELSQDLAPRIYNHRVAITSSFLIMRTGLCSSYHIGLGFNRSGPKKRFPVCSACGNSKCRRIGYDLSILTFQSQTDFWEP